MAERWHTKATVGDIFVVAHVLGWVGKALIFRDVWVSLALSAAFELCEFSLAFLLPNFSECWWDHWVLDFAVCNMAGIFAGQALLTTRDAGRKIAGLELAALVDP